MGPEKFESTTVKSDFLRSRTTCPFASRTAAVTVTSSTPDLNVPAGVWETGAVDEDPCAAMPAEAVRIVVDTRNATESRVTPRNLINGLATSTSCKFRIIATVFVAAVRYDE